MDQARVVVFELRKGPAWRPGISPGLLLLQLRHMRSLWRLRRAGLIAGARPVSDRSGLRGIVSVPEPQAEAARAALASDPAVTAGRLVVVRRGEEPA